MGTMPRSWTSTPMAIRPDDTDDLTIGDDTLVSIAKAMGPGPRTVAMAFPTCRASSQLRYSLATPRMPLVPNIFIVIGTESDSL